MTDRPFALATEQWQRLASARQTYTDTVSPYYDETLQPVAQRACVSGNIGKADIRALLKRSEGNQGYRRRAIASARHPARSPVSSRFASAAPKQLSRTAIKA